MALISELRYPTSWYAKLITALLALIFFALLATATISTFLLFRILSLAHTRSDIDTRVFPGHPEVVLFTVSGVGAREGWFFPGLKTAPTVILCHGYQSNRGELLTLVTALQEHQYNVFLFDFASHGASSGLTTLGFREAQELRAAVDTVARRDDVDRTRFGLWGTNLGGHAVVAVAETDPRVRAFAVDSVYDQPAQMLWLQVERSGLGSVPLVERLAQFGFKWLNYSYWHEPPLSARLTRLAGVAKLYIEASDEPELAQSTRELLMRSPDPREQLIIPRGNYAGMLNEDKHAYENRIVSFFLLRLPPSGGPRR